MLEKLAVAAEKAREKFVDKYKAIKEKNNDEAKKHPKTPQHSSPGIPHPAPSTPAALNDAELQSAQLREQINQATLYQMNAALYVARPKSKDYFPYKAPLSKLVEDGKDPTLAHNYSFERFKEAFEEQMNGPLPKVDPRDANWKVDAPRINMDYGKIRWDSCTGEIEQITDQDSFSVALNGLYIARSNKDFLRFNYQMEFEEEKRRRLSTERKKKAAEEERLEVQELADDIIEGRYVSSGPKKSGSDPEAGPISPRSSQISPRTSIPGRMGPTGPVVAQLSASELNAVKARDSVKKLLKGVGFKGPPESKLEERERFRAMLVEKSRTSYKRGGKDKETTPEDIRRISEAALELVPGEADDTEAEEDDDEDEELDNSDRIVAKLQELTKLEELTQVDGPGEAPGNVARWKECCALFRCDPNRTDMEARVEIAGLRTPIYQYQALGVYWQMITSRGIGGGFLADDMGLGKTLSYLAYIIVERQLAVLHRNVAKSRQFKDGLHLSEGEDGNCPTPPASGWIVCPCSASSPTSKLPLQPGLRMACVPAAVVKQWWDQWKVHVDVTEPTLGMKIAIDHPPVFRDNNLTTADLLSQVTAAQIRGRMDPKKAPKGAKANDEPKENNDGVLVLTTQEDFPKLVKEFSKSNDGFVREAKDPKTWVKVNRTNRCTLIFGIAMIDECHEEYFKNSGRAKVLTDLPRYNNSVRPFVWGYSGTPFSQTPRGIEGVLYAIEKHSDSIVDKFSWKRLDQICKNFDEQLKSVKLDNVAVDACLMEFKSFLTRFMIRRTADTTWFGHSLVNMKPHIHTDVALVSGIFTEDIRDYEKNFDTERKTTLATLQAKWDQTAPELRRSNIRPLKLGFNVMVRSNWRSRLLATVPYLQQLTSAELEKPLNLGLEEVQAFLKAPARDMNPYKKHIRPIVESSAKCLWLYNFIYELKAKLDIDGKDHKLVIMTAFPQVVYILSLFIETYFPEYKDLVGLVPGRMKPSEKVKIINAFTETGDDNAKTKKREVRILIGLTRTIGVGLQLQKACHVVLMEPDYEFVHELQAYGRVHRIGQKNPISRSFRLVDHESEIENKILQRQADRNETPGTKINEEEVRQTEAVLSGDVRV